MSKFMSYDPWAAVQTRNGFPGDEIISMLQKSIRRGNEKNALLAAYEMYITSPQMEDKLWRRLMVISVEDIGFGDPHVSVLVEALNRMRKEFLYDEGDRGIFFVHAIRYMCRCKKERSNDYIKTLLTQDYESQCPLEVPDYALDMHTKKGRELGRDIVHFYQEASRVIPQLQFEDCEKFRDEVLRRAKDKNSNTEKASDKNTFEYISFQS